MCVIADAERAVALGGIAVEVGEGEGRMPEGVGYRAPSIGEERGVQGIRLKIKVC